MERMFQRLCMEITKHIKYKHILYNLQGKCATDNCDI